MMLDFTFFEIDQNRWDDVYSALVDNAHALAETESISKATMISDDSTNRTINGGEELLANQKHDNSFANKYSDDGNSKRLNGVNTARWTNRKTTKKWWTYYGAFM